MGLHSKLLVLLATTIVFDRHHVGDEAEAALWTALGVGPEWLGDFITVASQWRHGALQVRASLEGGVHGMELISSVWGYATRWRKLVETRWGTVGAATSVRCCSGLISLASLLETTLPYRGFIFMGGSGAAAMFAFLFLRSCDVELRHGRRAFRHDGR